MRLRSYEVRAGGAPDAEHKLQAFQLRGMGDERDADDQREREDGAPWLPPPGFAVRPVVRRTLRALGVIDESDRVTLLALFDRAIAHADPVGAGEARVYSPQTPAVHLRVGPVHIELRVEAGGEVRLAPGTTGYAGQSVARNGDIVNADASLTAWFAAAVAKLNTLPGAPMPPGPVTIGAVTGSLSSVKA